MSLRYLWLIPVMVVLLGSLLIYFDVKNGVNELDSLHQKEKKLYEKYKNTEAKKAVLGTKKFTLASIDSTDSMVSIVNVIEANGFKVQALQPSAEKMLGGVSILPVKITLTGELQQLTKMLTELFRSPLNVGIQSFTFNVDEQAIITLEMHILILGAHFVDAFRLPKKHMLNEDFSIEQLKFAGYLTDNNEFLALLMSPTGKTQAAKLGAIIGSEKGRVVSIAEDQIIVATEKKQFVIHH